MPNTRATKQPRKPAVAVGYKYRYYSGEGNPNNYTFHVRGIVDSQQVVTRFWNKRKQRWSYGVEDMGYFEHYRENGYLIDLGRSPPDNVD